MGKWSLIDAYMIVMMIVAFHMKIEMFKINISVVVVPIFGFYAFLTATIMSLILTHIIIYWHRKVLESNT